MQPIIISTSPINGVIDVPVSSTIRIEFADPVITESVNLLTFILENMNSQTNISCTIELNNTVGLDDGEIVTVTPQDDIGWNGEGLNGLTLYQLTITGVTSADGDVMPGSYTMSFTTIADDVTEIPDADQDLYVDESYELYGRGTKVYEEPKKTYTERIEDNKLLINYLLTESFATEIDFDDFDSDSQEYSATQYLVTKTRYDLTYDKYITLASSAQKKRLADLSIEYRNQLEDLRKLLGELERAYKRWEYELLGSSGPSAPLIFQKGSTVDPIKDFHNRTIMNRAGEEL